MIKYLSVENVSLIYNVEFDKNSSTIREVEAIVAQ